MLSRAKMLHQINHWPNLILRKHTQPFEATNRSHNFSSCCLQRRNITLLEKCDQIYAGFRFARTESTTTNSYKSKALEDIVSEEIQKLPIEPLANVEDLAARYVIETPELAFGEIGLGGYTPVGLIQTGLEFLHNSCGLHWCTTILASTVILRILIFPFAIMASRHAARISNNLPQMQRLQLQLTAARQSGNVEDSARYAKEMLIFMKERDLSPFKSFLAPLAQAPLFILFFTALEGMTNAPVQSMRQGGLLWFTDLTVEDTTFILPLTNSMTLLLIFELTSKSTTSLSQRNMIFLQCALRTLPILIFPFTINFPAAILVYWTCSNFISLLQVLLLKISAVRKFFKIELIIPQIPNLLTLKKTGFVKEIEESLRSMQIYQEIEERQRLHEMRLSKTRRDSSAKMLKEDLCIERENIKAMVNSKRNKY